MSGRKLALGALAAFVVAFPLSGLWHTVLMSGFYESAARGTMREPPLLLVIGLAYLVVGLLMA